MSRKARPWHCDLLIRSTWRLTDKLPTFWVHSCVCKPFSSSDDPACVFCQHRREYRPGKSSNLRIGRGIIIRWTNFRHGGWIGTRFFCGDTVEVSGHVSQTQNLANKKPGSRISYTTFFFFSFLFLYDKALGMTLCWWQNMMNKKESLLCSLAIKRSKTRFGSSAGRGSNCHLGNLFSQTKMLYWVLTKIIY